MHIAKKLLKAFLKAAYRLARDVQIKIRYRHYLKGIMHRPLAKLPPVISSKAVHRFWADYCKINPRWAQYYYTVNGIASPAYIPSDMWFEKIVPKLNQRPLFRVSALADKNYLDLLFGDLVTTPPVLIRCINGQLLDRHFNSITPEQALKICVSRDEVVIKQSLLSHGGQDVSFVACSGSPEAVARLKNELLIKGKNYVVQDVLKQHPVMAALNSDSINTIRVLTLLWKGTVTVLGTLVRIGVKGVRVDNPHTSNGLSCVVCEDGKLSRYAYDRNWDPHEQLPGGMLLEGFEIPSFERVLTLVKKLHLRIPHAGIVGWDMAVAEDGSPALIEINLQGPEIYFHQTGCGPLIQDKKLFDEIIRYSLSRE